MALDATTWKRLSPLLDAALDLPPTALGPWLDALDVREPALAAEVRSLLQSEERAVSEGLLAGRATGSASQPAAGQRLGAYTLVQALGEGGMGAVWLAERSDGQFEGKVAVKLLHAGLVRPALVERFRREGAMLARLSHPHIARLLDAGLGPTGQPYLVLEHVEGQAIDAWCDAHRRTVAERVALFQQVLDAVAHAHARLVVHRDLKPGNVMVTPEGQVKLLDFGIAKLIDAEDGAGHETALTREGGQALTPLYAAPEQTLGQPVTTATDVYALGLLLFVLLTGQHPAVQLDGKAAVLGAEWPRASRIVTDPARRSASTLDQAAHARRMDTSRLASHLAGDLDNILSKCLKPEPRERYGTVDALADDLRRHLQGMTVRARPDTLGYRLSRFVRRYRIVVSITAVALLGVSSTAGVALWQWRQTQLALEDAEFSSRRGIAANTFAGEWMRAIAADITDPKARREVLDKARQILKSQRFEDDPTIQAYLLNNLATRYAQAGYPDVNVALAREVFELLPPSSSALDRSFAASSLAIALQETGQSREALAHAMAAHALLDGADDVEARAQAFQAESTAASAMGDHDRAVATARRGHLVLSTSGRVTPPMHRILMAQEAMALWRAGRGPEAAARAEALLAHLSERQATDTLTGLRMQALLARLAADAGDEAAVRNALSQPWAQSPKGRDLMVWPQAWLWVRDGRWQAARDLHLQAAATWSEGGAKLKQFDDAHRAFEISLQFDREAALRDQWPNVVALGEWCESMGADVRRSLEPLREALTRAK